MLIHTRPKINQFKWNQISAKLFLLIKPEASASLTAVELVRAISAVLQPIAVLRVAVAGPINTRLLSTRGIV